MTRAIGCILLAATVLAAPTDKPPGKAVTVDLSKNVAWLDFGYIVPGESRTARVSVANPTDQPITVKRVISACPCIQATAPAKAIPAGGKVALSVKFDAPKKVTNYIQKVIYITDSQTHRRVTLRLKARVGLPLHVKVDAIPMAPKAKSATGTLTVFNDGSVPVRLLRFSTQSTWCKLDLPDKAIPAGGSVQIPIKVTPPPKSTHAELQIRTSCKAQRTLFVGVKVTREPVKKPVPTKKTIPTDLKKN